MTTDNRQDVEGEMSSRTRGQESPLSPSADLVDSPLKSQSLKRKSSITAPAALQSEANADTLSITAARLFYLAELIADDLNKAVESDSLHECGSAVLWCLVTHPSEALKLARRQLHAWPYAAVPKCWTRLFEDASLRQAARILQLFAEAEAERCSAKRAKIDRESPSACRGSLPEPIGRDWIGDIVVILDTCIITTGAQVRKATIETVMRHLDIYGERDTTHAIPDRFEIKQPQTLETKHPIVRSPVPLSFEAFQQHLNTSSTPLIIPELPALTASSAMRNWQDPNYFVKASVGGRRLVPVEIGRSYTDHGWGQKIMSLGEYINTYLLPQYPEKIGYLAQYDLINHFPALRGDIITPDYCYTSPPDADEATLQTAGLSSAPALSEPILNAWIGPGGTKSPLHTDPYHNVLCQVVGYKYVRLYSPAQTAKLYPKGRDETGVNMDNTSNVDVSLFRDRSRGQGIDGRDEQSLEALRESRELYPEFEGAEFVEGTLGPGECLYIPVGWWHYVESLSTSCSVSFWWN